MAKITIDQGTVDLIEKFIGIVIRQLPNLAASGASIIALFRRTDDVTAEEMAQHRAALDQSDAELQAAIDQRLGRTPSP